jgi:hypothetical protein
VDLTREDEFVDLTIGEVAGTHGSGGADAKHDARAGGKPGAKPSLKRKATGDLPTAPARAPASKGRPVASLAPVAAATKAVKHRESGGVDGVMFAKPDVGHRGVDPGLFGGCVVLARMHMPPLPFPPFWLFVVSLPSLPFVRCGRSVGGLGARGRDALSALRSKVCLGRWDLRCSGGACVRAYHGASSAASCRSAGVLCCSLWWRRQGGCERSRSRSGLAVVGQRARIGVCAWCGAVARECVRE